MRKQIVHNIHVVNDLLAHVNGSAIVFESFLDRDDGPVDAGAVTARGGQKHPLSSGDGVILEPVAHARNPGHAEANSRAGHVISLR